ncbi:MAG TPA: endonuclease/exonuclease/phosphatase family protein, partial [Methylomicrobium sp.]|nr:endonuclease/exonuclease/phosphatase family protein [Methylomicrobium sp.]
MSSDYTSVTAVNTVISNDYDFSGFIAENITSVGLSPVFCCTPCASVYNASPALLWIRLPHSVPFQPRPMRSTLSSFVAFLLLTVESNPGPSAVRFGTLNAGSAVRKGSLIDDIIHDNRLDVLAVCESWIREDAPDAVKNDIAPPGYSVLHVHRPCDATGRSVKGGGLALIYSNDLLARPLKTKFSSSSFELQLIALQVTLSSFVAFLLLTVESNPGPSAVRFGTLTFIHDNRLDVVAVCESWIREDAPDAIKNDIAPPGYSVLHVHRPCDATGRSVKGGGLALIYSNDLSARPLKTKFSSSSFELQLIALQVGKILVKVANIYRPPSSDKSTFLDEFTELITLIGPGINERLMICGDFNLPDGNRAGAVDERLTNLLDVHGYQQHVTEPTRG